MTFYLEDGEDDGEEEEGAGPPLSPSRVKALGLCRGILGRVLPSLRSTASFTATPSSAVLFPVEWVGECVGRWGRIEIDVYRGRVMYMHRRGIEVSQ